MLNEDVDTQLTLFSEMGISKDPKEDKTARYHRLREGYYHAIEMKKNKKAFALLYAAIEEAKSLGDHEGLIIQSLLEGGSMHINEVMYAMKIEYPYLDMKDPVLANFDKAKLTAREAIAITKKLHGERNIETALAYKILADAKYTPPGKLSGPDPYKQKAIWCAERCEGPFGDAVGRIDGFRSCLNYRIEFNRASDRIDALGLMIAAKKSEELHDFAKADRSYLRWIEEAQLRFGHNHPVTAVAMNSYACFLRGQSRLSEAEKLEMKVDQIWNNELAHPTWTPKL